MKILMVVKSLRTGGAQKFVVELVNHLSLIGDNKVILLILNKKKDEQNHSLYDLLDKKVELIFTNKKEGFDVKELFKINRIVKKIKPDIIHTHIISLFYCIIPVVFGSYRVVHTIHSVAKEEMTKKIRGIYNFLFNYKNVIPVAISATILETVQLEYGNKHKTLIYNGVDPLKLTSENKNVYDELSELKFDQQTKIFSFVGRISEVKNVLLLINIFKELKENAILLIIGPIESDYSKECWNRSNKLTNVHMLGEKQNVADYLFYSEALLISSNYEGLPLVALEAMSLGVPVISKPIGGVPDIIKNGVNGYLSKDWSEDELRKTIVDFINNTPLDKIKIKNEFNDNYTMKKKAEDYMLLYKS